MSRVTTTPAPVTVVIPAFQAAAFIRDAVRSAIEQDPPPAAVIVVDDGSTDDTAELSRSVGALVITKSNGGEASARNVGLRAATTQWVAFLDADDRFLPGRLAAVLAHLAEHSATDVVTTNGYLEVNGQLVGHCYGPTWQFEADDQRTAILRRNFVFGHVVARRDVLIALGGFDESIRHATDWDMWARLVLSGGAVDLVDRPLSIYRVHAGSLSADREGMAVGSLAVLRKALVLTTSLPEREVARATIAAFERELARERLLAALTVGARDVRPRALRVAGDRANPVATRCKAAAAVVAPGIVATLLRRRSGHAVVATTGRVIARAHSGGPGGGPLVTVILTFLDEQCALETAIATVRDQTMRSWELLLVDDGSTDRSGPIADAAEAADPDRVRVLRHDGRRNCGVPASWNLGLGAARGGAIAFLGADDRWSATKLGDQLDQLASHPTAGMVCGPSRHLSVGSEPHGVLHPICTDAPRMLRRGELVRILIAGGPVMPAAAATMFRATSLRRVGGVPDGDSLYADQRTLVAVNLEDEVFASDVPATTYARRADPLLGSVEHDVPANSAHRRRFLVWTFARAIRSGPSGCGVAARVVGQAARHSVRALLRRVLRA
jgi:glycosyltransferase involved in cell wall biosynthesis